MTTPQNPGDPWAAQGSSPTSGSYPQQGYGADPSQAGYPQSGGYPQTSGYPQSGGYPQTSGYPQSGGYPQAAGYPAQPGYPAQQGYPQPGYGMPVYPGGVPVYGATALGPAPARPMTVTIAFWLWILAVVAGVLSVILIFTSDIFAQALREAGIGQLSDSYRLALNTARIVAVAGSLIFAGLYLLFAFKMRAGRNWARIVLTVLGALGIISALASTGTSATVNGVVVNIRPSSVIAVGWAQAVAEILSIVLMFVGGANQYFAAMKARRMYR